MKILGAILCVISKSVIFILFPCIFSNFKLGALLLPRLHPVAPIKLHSESGVTKHSTVCTTLKYGIASGGEEYNK